jgi:hypothetical protein
VCSRDTRLRGSARCWSTWLCITALYTRSQVMSLQCWRLLPGCCFRPRSIRKRLCSSSQKHVLGSLVELQAYSLRIHAVLTLLAGAPFVQ